MNPPDAGAIIAPPRGMGLSMSFGSPSLYLSFSPAPL
eukprot:CAMPEP_0175073646 /NCGR_PEP_ID=MMETSP0052_2-20121109/20724_1 /TAXON_ID=51329 ORGANISM="Polytomella parva, Strain SAG 63-3" /NCGR_SAMPLE_ID=MMETSP0052_2 /ASSEMBLY_ACC=CAM_ASM_000194 /LENGTH=36 /DNA_ID= /DNA_START= /DNA_END= /DNA_ORIENTATION=